MILSSHYWYSKFFIGAKYALLFSGAVTWNLRDTAMVDTCEHAIKFVERQHPGVEAKVIIWAHNSHVGDSSATERKVRREVTVGRLIRERFKLENTFNIGFSTDTGTVRAAKSWGADDKVMDLLPSIPGSHGDLFHKVSEACEMLHFGLFMRGNNGFKGVVSDECMQELAKPRIQRFIGVQYVKRSERMSHYSECMINKQYDMIIHMDVTFAVRPVEKQGFGRIGLQADYSKWDKYVKDIDDEED